VERSAFIRAIAPVWIGEVLLIAAFHIFALSDDTGSTGLLLSALAFPWVAGYRIANRGGSRKLSALGGASISLVSVVAVAVAGALSAAPSEALLGFVLATLMFAVVPQLLFGVIGHWSATRYARDI
jgi:hypothetical protein